MIRSQSSVRLTVVWSSLLSLAVTGGGQTVPARALESHGFGDARCLAGARRALSDHAGFLRDLESEVVLGVAVLPMTRAFPASPFAAFEGYWKGVWRGSPATHGWRSVDDSAQLVVIRDGPVLRRGVNLVRGSAGRGSRLCGLVEEPDGRDRLHEGRVAGPGHLFWRTPFAVYDERVATAGSQGRSYVIAERSRRTAARYTTRYAPWAPAADPLRRVSMAGVDAEWRIRGDRVHVFLRARTTGWVAMGFGDGGGLVGTRFVLARVVGGRGEAETHLAVPGAHVPLRTLGIADDIADVSGRERDGETAVGFSMPTVVPDPRVPDVRPGHQGHLWLAWSRADGFQRHSHARDDRWVHW